MEMTTKHERTKISLGQQIEEVERELGYRERVYPRLMAKGTLKPSYAEYQTQRMQAVLATLKWLQANESKIKALLLEAKVAADMEAVVDAVEGEGDE